MVFEFKMLLGLYSNETKVFTFNKKVKKSSFLSLPPFPPHYNPFLSSFLPSHRLSLSLSHAHSHMFTLISSSFHNKPKSYTYSHPSLYLTVTNHNLWLYDLSLPIPLSLSHTVTHHGCTIYINLNLQDCNI